MLALENEWVWDSWYLHDGQLWHCWFLKAPKSLKDPELRHWNVTQGHATSRNLTDWTYHGTSFGPSEEPSWDDFTTWTGSTVRGDDGRWHHFYTGTSRAEDGKIQRLGHAVGNDLKNWRRIGDGLCLDIAGPNARRYETKWQRRWHDRAMRDPWVMRNPDGDGWLMYFTARVPDRQETNDSGCIGLASSRDLTEWKLEAPVFAGGWGQLEVPQVFEHASTWYCLFCMTTAHQSAKNRAENGESGHGSHYLMAEHPLGPWHLPSGPALDVATGRYAARIVDQDGLKILGFKDGGPGDFGGYIMDPQDVHRNTDGTLSLKE